MTKWWLVIVVLGAGLVAVAGLAIKMAADQREQMMTIDPGGALKGSEVKTSQPLPSERINDAGGDLVMVITNPPNGAVVNNSRITVKGRTKPGAEISINDTDTKADVNGHFSASVSLEEGENYIFVIATDEDGNLAEQEVTLVYESVSE